MRIPSYHQSGEAREDNSMTPMIDVVFLLLIFFVCASVGQVRESLVPTDMSAGAVKSIEPAAEAEPLLKELWLRLRQTDAKQTIVEFDNPEFGQTFTDFNELRGHLTQLAEVAPEIPIILDIEPNVPVGDMIRVYATCQAANFESIHFATNPANTNVRSAPKK